MKNRKKEIARFIESMNVEELNSGSILLGMGESSVAGATNIDVCKNSKDCYGSYNRGQCDNVGACTGSENIGVCLDKDTQPPNFNCGC